MQPHDSLLMGAGKAATAIPPHGRVRVGYFWALDTLVSNLGGNPFEIFEKKGLDPQLFDDPDNTLECIAAIDLLEYCSSALGDPLFGLHLAALQEPDVFGCVVALAQAAPTLRQALQCLVDFIPVSASPECELKLVEMEKVVELQWRSHIGLGHDVQTSYHGLLIILKTLRMLGREQFQPKYASLTCSIARSDIDPISQHIGCRVKGSADKNAIAFSADALGHPMPTSNRLSYYLLSQGLAQLRITSRGDFEEKVRACVRRELSSGHCTVADCAERLRTSTRTLQNRLNRLKLKFSDIVLDERIKLAKHALIWSDYSLNEIAFQLGYAEQTSFGRAFKSATGLTPKAFRSTKRREN
ncbi:MAG TPA: AraC family transcriptional regulator ligand-binding domain-containing protein [Halioglobus sp.]